MFPNKKDGIKQIPLAKEREKSFFLIQKGK